jgi:DEAD/DEAH box helicase domain-containing protein
LTAQNSVKSATNPPYAPVLKAVGIHELFRHQQEAVHAAIHDKRSVVVATPTASGKSLAYTIPLLHKLGEKWGCTS